MPIYAILKFAAKVLQIIQICKDFSQKNIFYACRSYIYYSIFSKRIVFLTEITNADGNNRDEHFTRRRIPPPYLHAQLQTVVVHRQIDGYHQDVAQQLTGSVKVRLRERHIFLQPETCQQGYRKNNAQRRNMRRDCLFK